MSNLPAGKAGDKITTYLLYAIGEIVLVVAGILIAVQIDNANESRKHRDMEVHYLKNLKLDLVVSIEELTRFVNTRIEYTLAAKRIIDEFFMKQSMTFSEFNLLSLPLYNWEKYFQSNNTYQELINSGNLALIKNDSIKNLLLDLELLYKKLKSEEEHYRFDTDNTFYRPQYESIDVNVLLENFTYQATQGESGSNVSLSDEEMEWIYNDKVMKNGFLLSIIEYETMNAQMEEMKTLSQEIIKLIDIEVKK